MFFTDDLVNAIEYTQNMDADHILYHECHYALRDVERINDNLANEANHISYKMNHLVQRLNKYLYANINGLGELQRTAQELDRLCAVLEKSRHHLIKIVQVAQKIQ